MRHKPVTNYPILSVASLIQRASDTVAACYRDEKELREAKLDWNYVTKLAGLIKPCSE